MIVAAVFDAARPADVIGHMGEMVPFMLGRIEQILSPVAQQDEGLERTITETFCENFWVTTAACSLIRRSCFCFRSSAWTHPLLVDYPYASIPQDAPFWTTSRSVRPTKRDQPSQC